MGAALSVIILLGRYLTSAKFTAKSNAARQIDTGHIAHHLNRCSERDRSRR